MKRLIIMTSVFFGTLLIGSAFTGRQPFDGLSISLIGGLSIFILSYFIAGFLSRKKNSYI
ncbi:peptide ABC transporter permease [Listeria monocytogenes]|uniref:peptide ABC transporter permease n=1 Tax=Listeria monocytogenes TaxID=1639 RepID=UPI0010B94D6C|nr:peptide ABC transporter permease [Listeria monocytogenes]EAC4736821.1 peptide ABC transporter permease [Listeria monocytogenes]EAF9834590.1 peptide ABC transporter permease [Listeria monocytogenes]EFR5765925.1 peptide ABC transporter permease [Listeria monocytogenes]EIN7681083.1 peptide ABC transporter permease [Listeria monocytogenes]TYT99276.1 peptide ABC transporter permease [Listeria monocytogenes]